MKKLNSKLFLSIFCLFAFFSFANAQAKIEKCKVKDKELKSVKYKLGAIYRIPLSAMYPATLSIKISVKPELIKKETLALIARKLKQTYCKENRLGVSIFDNQRIAVRYNSELRTHEDSLRGFYSLDKTTGEDILDFVEGKDYNGNQDKLITIYLTESAKKIAENDQNTKDFSSCDFKETNASKEKTNIPIDVSLAFGTYKIRLFAEKTKEFQSFDQLFFNHFPNEDLEKLKTDKEYLIKIKGGFKTADGTVFDVPYGYLKKNSNNDYLRLEFRSDVVNGIVYSFCGKYLKEPIRENEGNTELIGILTKYKNGRMIARYDFPFYKYVEDH